MKALSCFAAAFLLLVAVGSSFAQTSNADRLIENVKAAEAELDTAKRLLAEARAEGEPLIARMAQLVERRKQLSDELDQALDASKRAQDNIKRIPAALEARRTALMDTISRMYRFGDPDSEIRKREAALAEIEAQIAVYETGVNQTRADADRAYERMEAVFAEKRRLDAEIDRLGLEVAMARGSIDGSETRLARAEEQLEIARDQARWEFNKNPPPILERVRVGPEDRPFYLAEWVEPAKETEELLKLAQYIHADLTRTIPKRQAAVDRMIEDVKREQEYTNARLREYVDMMGGSYDGWMGYLERGLDAVTFGYGGAVITAGSHTRKKIAIELTDSAVTVLRDAFVGDKKGRMPVHVALVYEAVFQVADALTREGPKNESWDVVKSWPKDQGIRHTHGVVNATDERAMIEGMTAERVMETLKQLKPLVSDQLEGENFRDRLLRAHGGSALAAAFTESAVFRVRPDVEILERDLLGSPLNNG